MSNELLGDFTDEDLMVEGEDPTPSTELDDAPDDTVEAVASAAPDPAESARQWVKENSKPGKDGKPFFPDEVFNDIVRPEIEKRINRFTGMLHERDERVAYLEQQLAEQNRRWEQLDASLSDAEINKMEAGARQKLKQAREQDDADSELEALDALAEAKARRLAAKTQVTQAASPPAPRAPAQPGLPEAMQEWLSRNSWYDAEGRDERSRKAQQEYSELLRDYQANSPRLYAELDQRLNGGAPAPKPGGSLSAATPGRSSVPGKRNAPRLTKEDLIEIRDIHGLDPNDKQVRADFLAAKIRAEREQ